MKKHWTWPQMTLLAATLTLVIVLVLSVVDLLGIGPNLGLPIGYYGRFNRVLAKIHASPNIEVVRTTLHRDLELEDFYITVRHHGREVRLRFEEAHTRSFNDLVQELNKVGL